MNELISRRKILKTSMIGALGISLPGYLIGQAIESKEEIVETGKPYPAYPSINPEIVGSVVGKSHFDLEGVQKMVEKRPELARACWEWRFGDFETAIGAASHVGRRDIVTYLLSKGATPDIFTFATLGKYKAVKTMIEASPGVQTLSGPHGISLLSHAEASLRMKDQMSSDDVENAEELIDYLIGLGDADGKTYLEVAEEDKPKYLGDYKYGDGADEGFSVKLNMRNLISLAAIGEFGGALYKISDQEFTYNGAPSVKIFFNWADGKVVSLTVNEPGRSVTAVKVS